jgi:peptidoglycan-N-acetylglucosamine deacetylase
MAVPTLTLTFDDGPDPDWTPRVLDALAAAGAQAAFFPLSPRAEAHPALVARMVAEGHEVGLHGWGHLRHTACAREEIEADTDRALAALHALGVHPRRWRLPWGEAAPFSADLAAARGLEIVGWTTDSEDWNGDDAATMLARVSPDLAPDAVVLLHDGVGPGATRADCAQTLELVPPLLAAARARGLEPAGLGT